MLSRPNLISREQFQQMLADKDMALNHKMVEGVNE